jgi:3-phosphoshikimate 1-carboxyvinyltransferase
VDSCGDHRIAMLAAAASTICEDRVTITRSEAVKKSYPGFFDDFEALGGRVIKERENA